MGRAFTSAYRGVKGGLEKAAHAVTGGARISDFLSSMLKHQFTWLFRKDDLKLVKKSLVGFGKGFPRGVLGFFKGLHGLVTDPVGQIKKIPETLKGMWHTACKAGEDPEAFGKMMGELAGTAETGLAFAHGAAGVGEWASTASYAKGAGLTRELAAYSLSETASGAGAAFVKNPIEFHLPKWVGRMVKLSSYALPIPEVETDTRER